MEEIKNSLSREDINKQAFLVLSNINATKITTNISDSNHETLINSFFTLQGMVNDYLEQSERQDEVKKSEEIFILMKIGKMTLSEINTLTDKERFYLSTWFVESLKKEDEATRFR